MTRDEGNKKRTDVVIDEASVSRDELIAAIAKLEQFASELHYAAKTQRGRSNEEKREEPR